MKKIKIFNRIGLAVTMVILVSATLEAHAQTDENGTTSGQGLTYHTIKLADYAKENKARMAMNSSFVAPVATETKLVIEPWMINPACFVGPGYSKSKKIEDAEHEFNTLRTLIDSLALETDSPLLLEAWMFDQNHFPVKTKVNREGHYAENQSK